MMALNQVDYQAEANRKGLYRLLRSLLKEHIFTWEQIDNTLILRHDNLGSSDAMPSCTFRIENPYYDELRNLKGYHECYFGQEKILTPIRALDCILKVSQVYKNMDAWGRLRDELANGMRNETLTLNWRANRDRSISHEAKTHKLGNMLLWAEHQSHGLNSSILIEQWAAEGHPYHPGSKTKIGFTVEDVLAYAPEFSPQVPLVLIAVHHSIISISKVDDQVSIHEWFEQEFPSWYQEWKTRFSDYNLDDYIPIPVHPWQLAHELCSRFSIEIEKKYIALDGPEWMASPTLSVRTLAPRLSCNEPYIKLPVAAQMTSSLRNLSSSSVSNAPIITKIVQGILSGRPDIRAALRCQWDDIGIHSCIDDVERDDGGYLSVIFRRNPCSLLQSGEHAVVVAALFAKSPILDKPLLIELMIAAKVVDASSANHWFRHYVDTLLQAVLDLYLDYGLAFEAHQQNMMAVFTHQGELKGFINRDVGGICIDTVTLRDAGWTISFTPCANIVSVRSAARNKFSHTVMQSQIAEIIGVLEGYFGLSSAELWKQVGQSLHNRFELWLLRLLDKYETKAAKQIWQAEYDAFFVSDWTSASFITMRLQDQSQTSVNQYLSNPLFKYYTKFVRSVETETINEVMA